MKTKRKNMKTMAASGFLLVFVPEVLASELKLEVGYGLDSNPFKLKQDLEPVQSSFNIANLHGEWDISRRFSVGFDAEAKQYASESKLADTQSWKADVNYDYGFKLGKKKNRSKLSWQNTASYKHHDESYVSSSTGELATSKGTNITDRYDYDNIQLKTGLKWGVSKSIKSYLGFEFNDKQYKNYQTLGLSNYDYQEFGIQNSWSWNPAKSHRFKLDLAQSARIFDDKRQKNRLGSSIKNSDLQYDIQTLDLGYRWKKRMPHSSKLTFKLNAAYDHVTDNGPGYYSYNKISYRSELRYYTTNGLIWGGSAQYSDTHYPQRQQANEDADDESYTQKQGATGKLFLEFGLKQKTGLDLIWYTHYQVDQYDADKSEYGYDRNLIETGIRLKAF